MTTLVETVARAMLQAADDDHRIQGFLYGNAHVVRDVLLPPGQQELWRVETDDYQAGHDAMMDKIAAINTERQAIAALEAMREPTEGMVETGACNIPPFWSEGMRGSESFGSARKAALSSWRGMIDAALQEHSNLTGQSS